MPKPKLTQDEILADDELLREAWVQHVRAWLRLTGRQIGLWYPDRVNAYRKFIAALEVNDDD